MSFLPVARKGFEFWAVLVALKPRNLTPDSQDGGEFF